MISLSVIPRHVIFHVPHDGCEFPPELMESVCVPYDEFMAYHEKMSDKKVHSLVPPSYRVSSVLVASCVSRLLCDVERFIGPEEIMEQYGMGFCYERVYDGTKIKNVTEELKDKTLKYYWQHHKSVDALCEQHSPVLLFDMHSYSDDIVMKDFLEAGRETPDVCIGTDSRYTPPFLAELTARIFEEVGFTTALNYPYSGCFVPNTVFAGNAEGNSLMLEFNKRIYLDANGELIAQNVAAIHGAVLRIISDSLMLPDNA